MNIITIKHYTMNNTPTKAIRFTSAGGHTYRLNINQIEVTALPDDRHKLLMDNFSKEELIKAAQEMHRGYVLNGEDGK